MKMKKLLALLLSLLMLVALFSACANNEGKTDDQGSTSSDQGKTDDKTTTDDGKTDDGKTDDGKVDDGDAPVETDMKTITWFGCDSHQWEYTMNEAKDFATWKEFMRIAEEEFNIKVDWSVADQDAYLTTLNGLIAGNTLPDSFFSQGSFALPDDTVVEMINQGKFAPMDDVLAYSNSAAELFAPGGPLDYLKAWAMSEDGNWYYIKIGNNTAKSLNLSNSTMTQRVAIQVHGAYGVNIRQDWLDKLGLAMPQTIEEFRDALVTMQTEDVNGNGAADERYTAHIGTINCYQGVAQWFGLPNGVWKENPGTGVIEFPHMMEGYKPWLTYMNGLYNDKVLYNNDGGSTWSYSTYCGGDYVSAYTMMQDYLWRTETGDPDADYEPMPIIQAVDGITPRFIAQECVAGGAGITFNANVDLEAAARFVDFTHSQQFAMVFEHGIEGVAYDWNEDGETITTYVLSDDQDEYGAARTQYLNTSGLPGVHIDNVWGIQCYEYANVDEAIANNETYTEQFTTREDWMKDNNWNDDAPSVKFLHILSEFGQENFNPTIVYSFVTLPTTEEATVISTYKTDLETYLLEMTTNAITGASSIDQIDEQLQYAYDNLGLQEYYNVMQARYNRFLVSMGFDAIEIVE